jgi:hypothetical protein
MEAINTILIFSIAVGGAIFVAIVLFWFVSAFIKKRVGPEGSAKPAAVSTPSRGPWDEKRTHPRRSVSWPASIPTPTGPLTAQLRDISLGGAFVACPSPLALSERFRITIEIPGRPVLTLHAEVVWSNANVSAEAIVHRGMGIRFVENDAASRRALAEALSIPVARASVKPDDAPRTTINDKAG